MKRSEVEEFIEKWNKGEYPDLRLGQAFYNYFHKQLPHPFPELFYEVAQTKVWNIINNLTNKNNMNDKQKETKRRAEIMIAFSEGAEIQFCDLFNGVEGEWNLASVPRWNWAELDYRIKPEPREPRVIYINEYEEGSPSAEKGGLSTIFSLSEDKADFLASKGFIRTIKFVEVVEDEQV